MKIVNKVLIAIITFALLINQNVIFASMADYTDEQADNNQKQEQEEWKHEQEEKMGKSSNNYLKSLSVSQYEISPSFDKQTINYIIIDEITEASIEIKAEADDEKSSVSGTGKIDLNLGENNLKIDVTAENGTVRTYYIKVVCASNNTIIKKEEETKINENRISQIQSKDAEKELKENTNNNIYIIVGVFVLFILIILVLKRKKNGTKKYEKHKGKH